MFIRKWSSSPKWFLVNKRFKISWPFDKKSPEECLMHRRRRQNDTDVDDADVDDTNGADRSNHRNEETKTSIKTKDVFLSRLSAAMPTATHLHYYIITRLPCCEARPSQWTSKTKSLEKLFCGRLKLRSDVTQQFNLKPIHLLQAPSF